ncbi:MAG: tyrosine-type recombinase/integrase [Candidatus Acidiferrales bacterium]
MSLEEHMGAKFPVCDVRWERYPRVAESAHPRAWLTWQCNRGLAANTLEAYGRGLERYLLFLAGRGLTIEAATRLDVAAYVRDLLSPGPTAHDSPRTDTHDPLANATLQQRVTVIRLFYDYLVEEGVRERNPVRQSALGVGSLVPRFRKLPWIPNDEQWQAVLEAARRETLRNRVMLAMSYDCALRREELCNLETGDIDPAHRMVRIRAENTKGRRERVVPYSEPTSELYARYLGHRRQISRDRGKLFLSESHRNLGQPLPIWTWSKRVAELADRSGVEQFTTHTPRHLCLTDLARTNWDIHEIATFAGHRSIQTTLLYIHLSGRELAAKLAQGMAEIHAGRVRLTAEMFR